MRFTYNRGENVAHLRKINLLFIFALIIALSRLAFIHDLPEWDVATYTLIGRELIHGRSLYADIWDMKPPAIFGAYAAAQFIAGEGAASRYLLSLATSITTMLAIYFAAQKLWGKRAGLWAAALWTVVCAQPSIEANLTNTEALINAFLALGLATFVRHTTWRSAIAVSVMFGVATMSKHVALVPALAIVFTMERFAGGKWKRIAITLLTLALSWAALFAYAAMTGRARLFFDTAFVYPRFYGGNIFLNLLHAFRRSNLFPSFAVEFVPMIALAALAFCVPSKARGLLIALFIATFIAVALPGQSFLHYYQLWLMPLSLAGGFGAILIERKGWLGKFVPPLVLVGLIVLQVHGYALSPRDRLAMQHPASTVLNVVDDADEIRRAMRPDESLFVWADEPQVYVLAGKRPPGVALWRMHTVDGPMSDWLTRRTLERLERVKPDLIVTPIDGGPADHPITRWMGDRYIAVAGDANHFPLSFLVRRGSDLERRLGEMQPRRGEAHEVNAKGP